MKGKIVSIPLFPADIKAGMQIALFHKDGSKSALYVDAFQEKTGFLCYGYPNTTVHSNVFLNFGKDSEYTVKGIIVEFEQEVREGETVRRELPMKYSQWKTSLDKNEVDSGKEITFETIETKGKKYAKIIPPKKKIAYPVV